MDEDVSLMVIYTLTARAGLGTRCLAVQGRRAGARASLGNGRDARPSAVRCAPRSICAGRSHVAGLASNRRACSWCLCPERSARDRARCVRRDQRRPPASGYVALMSQTYIAVRAQGALGTLESLFSPPAVKLIRRRMGLAWLGYSGQTKAGNDSPTAQSGRSARRRYRTL